MRNWDLWRWGFHCQNQKRDGPQTKNQGKWCTNGLCLGGGTQGGGNSLSFIACAVQDPIMSHFVVDIIKRTNGPKRASSSVAIRTNGPKSGRLVVNQKMSRPCNALLNCKTSSTSDAPIPNCPAMVSSSFLTGICGNVGVSIRTSSSNSFWESILPLP